jgi:hypothetical protein
MRRRGASLLFIAAALEACGGRVGQPNAIPVDATGDASLDAPTFCDPPPIDVYAPNLTKEGEKGRFTFVLVESRPAPPQKGMNTFIVAVRDASGPTELDLSVVPTWGRSGHSLLPTATFDTTSLTYTVDPLYFFAGGRWEIEMRAYPLDSDAGPPLDSAVFYFCIGD